ncbi:hypothetical protein OG401_04460 [Kitasatospora purpeofusca]|uniref:hypothetical protein n=1 Tax=Kitasatospora purpeofusca TaxID=67352 RepID=UPI0022584C21|nr:hypothetical protein [Kitasatospora purpeofusca]MCX4683566.1 hypothetical protein [Kitasatospora purpeofusca]
MIDRIMRANYHLSYRMRHQAYKVTQERMEELERSLRLAGLTGQSAIAMRQAAWRHAYSWRKYAWNMFGAAVLLAGTIGVGRGSGRLVLLVFPPALPVVKLVVGLVLLVVLCGIALLVFVSSASLGWLGIAGKFVPVKALEDVVNACATVLAAGPRTRADHIAHLPVLMRYTEKYVLKMYWQRATVPRASHRRSQLREHGRLVAARLRAAEAGLDVDAAGAAKEIADLVVQIADNYVAGRVGALLPKEELKDLQPIQDYTARLLPSILSLTRVVAAAAVVAIFAGAGTWVASRFGIPPSFAALPAIALATVLFPALVSVVTPQAK